MHYADMNKANASEMITGISSGAVCSSKMYSWGKRSRSCGNARQSIGCLQEVKDWPENCFLVKISGENSNDCDGDEDPTEAGGALETLIALKGITLKEALSGLVRKYQLNMDRINVFLKSSNTPLPLETDTSFLGGLKVFLKAKENHRKASGTNVGPSSASNNGVAVKVDAPSGKQERKLSLGTISKRKSEKLLLAALESGANNGEKQDSSSEIAVMSSSNTDSISARKERSRSHGRLSQIFPNPFKVVDRADMLDRLMQLQEEGLKTAASFLPDDDTLTSGCGALFLEDHWHHLVKSPEELSRKQQKQQEGLWELISTELEYICKLGSLIELQSCVRSLQQEGVGTELDVDTIFGNISEICRANLGFWLCCVQPLLQHSRQSGEPLDPSRMEAGFSRLDNLFRPYIPYCLSHVDVLCYIRQKLKESEFFRDLIVWIQSRKAFGRLHLTDLLAKPMQRLTKYPLLLKAVLSNTTDTAMGKSIHSMIEKAEEFATRVNVELCFKQHYDTLCSIMQCIDSYEVVESANDELDKLVREFALVDLTSPMPGCRHGLLRRQLMRGDLKLRESYNKTEVMCFLFTDMFLVCKQTGRKGDRPRVKIIRPPFHIESVVVKQLRETNGFMFIYMNEFRVPAYACVFYTSTLEETYRWLENFQIAKEEYGYLSAYDFPNLIGYADKFGNERGYPSRYMAPVGSEQCIGVPKHRKVEGIKGSAPSQLPEKRKNERLLPPRRTSMGAVDYRTESSISGVDINHRKCNSMDTSSPSSRKSFDAGRTPQQEAEGDILFKQPQGPVMQNLEREVGFQRPPFTLPNFFPVNRMFPMEKPQKEPNRDSCEQILATKSSSGCKPSSGSLNSKAGVKEEQQHLGDASPSSRRLERRYHTADGIEALKSNGTPSCNILKRFSWNTAASSIRGRPMSHHPSCRKASTSTASSESCCSSSGISSSSSPLYCSQSENELAEGQLIRGTLKNRRLSFVPTGDGHQPVDQLVDLSLFNAAARDCKVDPCRSVHVSSFIIGDNPDNQAASLSPSPLSCSSSSTICASSNGEPNPSDGSLPECSNPSAQSGSSVQVQSTDQASGCGTDAEPMVVAPRRHSRHREDLLRIIYKAHLESSTV